MEKIGQAIRSARKSAGLNQSELAKKMDVTQTAITHWENGVHTPTLQKVVDLAEALDTSFAQITASLSSTEMTATYELTCSKGGEVCEDSGNFCFSGEISFGFWFE
jgi:transcriptional regulator with XRE-family HTH domain